MAFWKYAVRQCRGTAAQLDVLLGHCRVVNVDFVFDNAEMLHGLTQLHHHALCQTLGVDVLQRDKNRRLCNKSKESINVGSAYVPIGRAKSLKRPAHPAVLGLIYVFRGLRRKSGRSQDLPDR